MPVTCNISARWTVPLMVLAGLAWAAPIVNAQTYTLQTLATFNSFPSGQNPQGGLTLSADGSILYGTAKSSGTGGYGTLYSVPISGGTITPLVAFAGPNGASPVDSLTPSAGGTLYGTTYNGGNGSANGYGTVFSFNPGTGTFNTLASFNSTNGAGPIGSLDLIGSNLYGTTYTGANTFGTVFSVPITGGTITTLASFSGYPHGSGPQSALTLSADGTTFYGTTILGGSNGTLYSLPVAGGTITTLSTFVNAESPIAGLTLSPDGKTLYGTTDGGPSFGGSGTIYAFDISTGTIVTLATFTQATGTHPHAGLTLSADGKTLYGATTLGGTNNFGTIFSLPVTGGTVTPLASFNGTNGANPVSNLTLGANGAIYGTSYGSDSSGSLGTVFVLTPTPEPPPSITFGIGFLGLAVLMRRACKHRAVCRRSRRYSN